MDHAQASLEDGVLRVRVHPQADYAPRKGRVVEIYQSVKGQVEQARGSVKETVDGAIGRVKAGLTAAAGAAGAMRFSAGKQQTEKKGQEEEEEEDAWDERLSASESEETLSEHVRGYVEHLAATLHVPTGETSQRFVRLVQQKTERLARDVRGKVLAPLQMKTKILEAAEEVWSAIGKTGAKVGPGGAAKEAVEQVAKGYVEKGVHAAKEFVDRSWAGKQDQTQKNQNNKQQKQQQGDATAGVVQRVKEVLQDALGAGKQKAAEFAADTVFPKQKQKASGASNNKNNQKSSSSSNNNFRDTAAQHRAEEAAEREADRAKEQAHAAQHRAQEAAARQGTSPKNGWKPDTAKQQQQEKQSSSNQKSQDSKTQTSSSTGGGLLDSVRQKLAWIAGIDIMA